MSSLTLLESSSETSRSLKSESSNDSIPIIRNYDPNYSKAKLWLASAESKLKVKPLSLRFRPKYRAGGDELCRAAEELYKCGHHLQCLALLQRAKDCYVRAHLVIRAAKTLELGLTIAIQHCYKDINRSEVRTEHSLDILTFSTSQLLSLADSVHSLYLTISQPDDAVRALEEVAGLLLQDRACSEDVDKGLALLSKALNTLVTSGRHSRAGSVAMQMLNFGYNHHHVGSEMIDVGKTCLRMFVMTNNINMTDSCLITLVLLLIKHFENNAKTQANILYQDNVGNISKEVRDNLKTILEADWDAMTFEGEIEELRSKIKAGGTKELLLEEFTSSPECLVEERRGRRVAKSSLVLAGAALPLSVLAFNPRSRGGVSQFREVSREATEQNKQSPRTVHADENGYEAFQPHDDIMATPSEY